jgi:hypothetical protein
MGPRSAQITALLFYRPHAKQTTLKSTYTLLSWLHQTNGNGLHQTLANTLQVPLMSVFSCSHGPDQANHPHIWLRSLFSCSHGPHQANLWGCVSRIIKFSHSPQSSLLWLLFSLPRFSGHLLCSDLVFGELIFSCLSIPDLFFFFLQVYKGFTVPHTSAWNPLESMTLIHCNPMESMDSTIPRFLRSYGL